MSGASGRSAAGTFEVMIGDAVLRCDVAMKQALLRAVVAANLDIGTVQPMRAASLEEAYLKHAGATS